MDIQEYTFPPFRGLNFKDAPLNMPPAFARKAQFVEFDLLGAVSKAKAPGKTNASQITGHPAILGLWEYLQTDGDKFFIAFGSDGKFYRISYADGSITDITPANVSLSAGTRPHFLTYNNVVYIGDGVNRPIYLYNTASSTDFFRVGVTAPASACAAANGAAGVLTGAYSYKVVYESPTGARSNASAASNTVNPVAQQVNLTLIPTNGNAQENVARRLIYRTTAGGAVYYFLTTINDNTTASFIDNISDTALGERLQEEKETPPNGLWGFVEYAGSVYGFVKGTSDLMFSQINEGEAWGAFNIEPITPGDGSPITGLGALNRLCIFKDKSVDTWEGIPGLFRRIRRSKKVGCVSHNTIRNVDLPDGGEVLMFLSRQGVYMFDEQDVFYLSREIETIFNGKDQNYIFNASRGDVAQAEYNSFEKKYYLSIPTNGSTENNLLLVYDVYAQSWSTRPIFAGALAIKTRSDGYQSISGGESRSDATFGGFIYTVEESANYFNLDYKGEYTTAWNSLNYPNNIKLIRYIELDLIAQGEFNMFLDLYLDGSDIPFVTRPVSVSTGGSTWDIDFFDVGTFGSDTYLTDIQGAIRAQGRNISLGFRTNEKDKPWKVLGARVQYQLLPPSGDRK